MDNRQAEDHINKIVSHFIIVSISLILFLFGLDHFAYEFVIGIAVLFLYSAVILIKLASNRSTWTARVRKVALIFFGLLIAEITFAFFLSR